MGGKRWVDHTQRTDQDSSTKPDYTPLGRRSLINPRKSCVPQLMPDSLKGEAEKEEFYDLKKH